jgi:hypothetical protein
VFRHHSTLGGSGGVGVGLTVGVGVGVGGIVGGDVGGGIVGGATQLRPRFIQDCNGLTPFF